MKLRKHYLKIFPSFKTCLAITPPGVMLKLGVPVIRLGLTDGISFEVFYQYTKMPITIHIAVSYVYYVYVISISSI